MKVYGIRLPDESFEDVRWESDRDYIVKEFNSRDDKHWNSDLLEGDVTQIRVLVPGNYYSRPPWERDYEGHYYEED